MDPAKIQAIREWEAPMSVRDVQCFLGCFLGFANFYRRFVHRYLFAKVPAPLRLDKEG
jgi:hypothetical protein